MVSDGRRASQPGIEISMIVAVSEDAAACIRRAVFVTGDEYAEDESEQQDDYPA